MDTAAASPDSYEAIVGDLLELYPALMAERERYAMPGYRRVAHLAHGWYLRCHRGVEAILILEREGYAEEASPIRRSIIEHVVALRWLSAEGDKIADTVARGYANDVENRMKAVTKAGWTSVDLDELVEIINDIDAEDRDRTNDRLQKIAHRQEAYGDTGSVPGYLSECARTHPGYESAICYVEVPSGALLSESRTDNFAQAGFAARYLIEALLALRIVFEPSPWGLKLNTIADRFRAVTDRISKATGASCAPPSAGGTGSNGAAHPLGR